MEGIPRKIGPRRRRYRHRPGGADAGRRLLAIQCKCYRPTLQTGRTFLTSPTFKNEQLQTTRFAHRLFSSGINPRHKPPAGDADNCLPDRSSRDWINWSRVFTAKPRERPRRYSAPIKRKRCKKRTSTYFCRSRQTHYGLRHWKNLNRPANRRK